MGRSAVVLLGADACTVGIAGRLARGGHEVVLWEAPSSAGTALRLGGRLQVRLSGAGGEATATVARTTDDVFAALAAGDVLITCLPAGAQETFTRLVLPLVEPRHTLVLLDGPLSGLVHAKWLRDHGRGVHGLPTLVESDVTPLQAHMPAFGHVHVANLVAEPGLGVFPADRTATTLDLLRPVLPGARPHRHVLSAALAAVVPFLRAPTALLNMGALQHVGGGSALFANGFSAEVARVVEALDAERLAIAAALGLELPTAAEALHQWGLGPLGGLWAAVNGSYALTREPGRPVGRERVCPDEPLDAAAPCLRAWLEVAGLFGVRTPLLQAFVALNDAAATPGGQASSRSLGDLGLGGMDREGLIRFLETGSEAPRPDEDQAPVGRDDRQPA